MRKRFWRAAVWLALLAFSGSYAQAAGLLSDGAPPDVAMVFTGDVIGYLDPCG